MYRKILRIRRKQALVLLLAIAIGCSYVWVPRYPRRSVSNEVNLQHFRRSRSLKHYMDGISLLTEPWSTPCDGLGEVSLVVLVASVPSGVEYRDAIRTTWAQHIHTYFLLGHTGNEEEMENIYWEAKQYNDLIVYDFQEHYQNLTLKTALMLRWTGSRCPQAGFMLKTDDDVVVNPWKLLTVIKENPGTQLIGFKFENIPPIRDEYGKWYLPRWLFEQESIPEYLSGAAYLIKGKYVQRILDAGAEVPLVNLEDVYFTYLVAYSKLGLNLTHDGRLYPYKPYIDIPCRYLSLATAHDFSPQEMARVWRDIAKIAERYPIKDVCASFLMYYLSFFIDVS